MVFIDIISHMLIGLFLTVVFWPYLGPLGFIAVLGVCAWLIRAWLNADLIVAAKAGFRPATLVQRRYLEYLGIGQEVFTHPSLLPAAGALVSSRRRLILLSSGVFDLYERKDLSEDDLRRLIAKLSARDRRAIIGWTFHLATGGARLFAKADRDDPAAGYWRRTIAMAGLGGVVTVLLAGLVAASISTALGRPIDISPIVPVFWLPFAYVAARWLWRWGNGALIRTAGGDWNSPITLEQMTFLPMSAATGARANFDKTAVAGGSIGGHPNLNLLRDGLLIAQKRPSRPLGDHT